MTSKSKILVIEDEEDILALVHYNLVRNGFNVDIASSGEEGLQKARQGSPDLIVLDLMLPSIDGLEVCRQLRGDQGLAKTAIVMMTAKGEEEDIIKGLEYGADDYITKPFSPQVLVARIKAERAPQSINSLHDFQLWQSKLPRPDFVIAKQADKPRKKSDKTAFTIIARIFDYQGRYRTADSAD